MTAVKAYREGNFFIPVSPIKAAKNQRAIVTVLDDTVGESGGRDYPRGSLSDEDCRDHRHASSDGRIRNERNA
jgi:hypothetical protein